MKTYMKAFSDLGIHTKTTRTRGIMAFAAPGQPNVDVLLEYGTLLLGSLAIHRDGTFLVA